MHRYFIFFQYKGTNYHGWQIQPNAHSVQAEIENNLQIYFQKKISISAAGRTDAGVHAKLMVAHFESDNKIVKKDFIFRINNMLPKDISIITLNEVLPTFHARFDAQSRTYEYHLIQKKDPFFEEISYRVSTSLNFVLMNTAASFLIGEKDFSCFSKSKTQTYTNLCTIMNAKWNKRGEVWVFEIKANRFLRNMVRAIVGTLIEVGQGKRTAESIINLIESKSRSEAGLSVPAAGLFLTDIQYPSDGFC